MYRHAFTAISHAAISDRVAGRLDLFFFCGRANGVFRAAYASSGGLSREPVTDRSALDWNCLRYRIPDYFDAVFTLACGVGTAVRIPSYSALHHARADVEFHNLLSRQRCRLFGPHCPKQIQWQPPIPSACSSMRCTRGQRVWRAESYS